MNNPLVSIIVPVYNVQNSVARCLESICAQTWKDIEVILVNDGSRDESFSICEQFREKDPRIVLVDKSNSGVSETRNCGMSLARDMPQLRVSDTPELDLSTRTMRGSFSRNCSQMEKLSSRDPSLTRMTSISFHVWAQMLSRQRATLFCTLYTGTIMLTSGLFMTEGLLFTDIIPLY